MKLTMVRAIEGREPEVCVDRGDGGKSDLWIPVSMADASMLIHYVGQEVVVSVYPRDAEPVLMKRVSAPTPPSTPGS